MVFIFKGQGERRQGLCFFLILKIPRLTIIRRGYFNQINAARGSSKRGKGLSYAVVKGRICVFGPARERGNQLLQTRKCHLEREQTEYPLLQIFSVKGVLRAGLERTFMQLTVQPNKTHRLWLIG